MIFLELNCAMKYQCKFWAGIKLKIVYWISVKKHVYLTNCSGNKICSTLQPPAFRSCLIIGQINWCFQTLLWLCEQCLWWKGFEYLPNSYFLGRISPCKCQESPAQVHHNLLLSQCTKIKYLVHADIYNETSTNYIYVSLSSLFRHAVIFISLLTLHVGSCLINHCIKKHN